MDGFFSRDIAQRLAGLCSKIAGKLTAAVQKLGRAIRREHTGESNRILVPTVAAVGMTAIITETSVPNDNNQLEFEAAKATVDGKRRDVHRVRCLDGVIGSLTGRFNGVSKVPYDVLAKVASHIADVSASLQSVRAYAEIEKKTAVGELAYVNTYINTDGVKTEQVVAKIKLGASS